MRRRPFLAFKSLGFTVFIQRARRTSVRLTTLAGRLPLGCRPLCDPLRIVARPGPLVTITWGTQNIYV